MKKNIPSRVLCLAVLAALAAGGCVFNATRITTQRSGQATSDGLNLVSLDTRDHSGNITVNGTTDPIVKATVTVSEIAIQGSGETAADQLTVSITPAGGVGTVGFSVADKNDAWEVLRLEDVTLVSDQALDVWSKTTSGNINLTGINGFVDLETTSGNVTADVVRGCYIAVTSGNIDVSLKPDSTFASATLKTTSGNIKITVPKGFKANLDLSATSGNITAPGGNKTSLNGGNPSAVISCSATSGNVTVQED
jgi:DUF4097 and DUF4098 domain-containing protein YvlB